MTIDPRHGQRPPPSDLELQEDTEKRREAYLNFVSDLEAASPEEVVCHDTSYGGMRSRFAFYRLLG